jgi:ABC-type nitrate/sulfonate/bicarbonate transport system substrate-binding protein
MKKVFIFVLVFLVLVIVFFGYKNSSSKPDKTSKAVSLEKFKLAVPNNVSEPKFVLGYAKDNGFLEKQGIDLEVVPMEQAPYQAVAGGQVDAMFGGLTRPMTLYLNQSEPRLLMNLFNTFDNHVVSRYPQNESDKIKKVAINAVGGETRQMTDFILKKLNLDPARIEHVTAPSVPARIAMLENGDVDLIILPSQEAVNIVSKSDKYYQLNSELLQKDSFFLRSIISNKEIIEKNPEKMQKFIVGLKNAVIDERENKAKSIAYIKKELAISDDESIAFYTDFMSASAGISFAPSINDELKKIADMNKEETTNPERDLAEFIYNIPTLN